ncbi:hypothetical protein I79_004400 [Cricetulus griseus]|uniref:Uncharacterized protein n=1 Tax=Cricetulus griseus TaxID=10029 RepID=G3H2I7_CRIGR|nr:hypothetical protein I79_004400 [Cricetulus griseus]
MVGPVFGRSATLGQVVLGLFCLILVIRIELNVLNHKQSEKHHFQEVQCALGLAAQATDFTLWETDPTG